MIQQSDIITKASEFVSALFKDRLPGHLLYHTIGHTRSVAKNAVKIGKAMKLGEEGLEIVALAAWLHDTGYTEKYAGHEEVSIRIATEFLQNEYYPQEKIDLVIGCIRATKIPQQPKNLLEEIVADADLSGLGKKSFFEKSELLHHEWDIELKNKYSDIEWTQQNIHLLSGHKYFTSVAQDAFSKRQEENLLLLHKKLRKLSAAGENIINKQDEPDYEFIPERPSPKETNTQMLFKLVSNTLMIESLSADHKSVIIIFSSSLMMVFIFAILIIFKLNNLSDLSLFIPLILLSFVSAISFVYAILAVRQHNESGFRDGVQFRKPLFGFFYAMKYDDFDKKMKEINEEDDFLPYGNLSEEYFNQRYIVAKKYHFLHRSYTVFMYGFCLTILTFFLLHFLHV